jgi:hypothetical protein
MHRNRRCGGPAIAELAKLAGNIQVESAASSATNLLFRDVRYREACGRIEDREIEAELVESFVQEARQQGRGAVKRVLCRNAPEGFLGAAGLRPLAGFIVSDFWTYTARRRNESTACVPATSRR